MDFAVLAALAPRHLPLGARVDVLNVAFPRADGPDRVAAAAELRAACSAAGRRERPARRASWRWT